MGECNGCTPLPYIIGTTTYSKHHLLIMLVEISISLVGRAVTYYSRGSGVESYRGRCIFRRYNILTVTHVALYTSYKVFWFAVFREVLLESNFNLKVASIYHCNFLYHIDLSLNNSQFIIPGPCCSSFVCFFCAVFIVFSCLSSSCVLCAQCCRFIWIVHFWLSLRFPVTLIWRTQLSLI